MSSLDYLDLCRLCLVKDQVSVPIFDGEGDVRQIFLKIAACLPVKLTRDDKLPKKICNDCVYKVELFYEFWNTTSNSEKQLMQWLGEVDVNDKQTYVTAVINQDQSSDNRLDGNVMQQTNEHQNNMGMNIIETMSLEMPMMMSTDQTQMTINTTNNSNSQSIQALPGTSAQQKDGMGESEEDNSDDDMDRDEGLPVKEEIIQDTNRIIEPGAFLNVSLPCDEPGPSGLQQQKNADIPDMVIGGQTTESDNKAGEGETFGGLSGMLRQILSPSPETNDGSYSSCCSMIQPGIFTNYPMLSPTIQHVIPTSSSLSPYHHTSHSTSLISLEQATANLPIDHLEIHVQTQQCNNCGLEFHSISKFNYHIRICQQNINDELRRRNDGNIDIIQNQNIKYSCTLCGRLFQTLNHLRMHEVSHSSQLQQQMQQPIQQLQQQQQIDILTNNEQTFRCDKCQASFRYRTLLERHKKIHIIGQDKPYVCPRCPMRFETRTLYNHHAKTHKPIVNANEQIIGNNQMTNINNLNSTSGINQSIDSKLLIESSGSYKCDSCTKQFLTIESLTSHKAIHRSRPLICDVCGKGFTHRKYYVVHQRIHTGERPYLCAMCGKSFTQASTLTVHRRYHTGERPYTCTLCGKGFVTRTIMLNHMKKH